MEILITNTANQKILLLDFLLNEEEKKKKSGHDRAKPIKFRF